MLSELKKTVSSACNLHKYCISHIFLHYFSHSMIGKRCEAVINMCHFNLCQNNAICQRFQSGGYQCICQRGFTG